jgi:hypothetical protein
MGTGAVIVHDKNSQEVYHDWEKPAKFDGLLEKIYDNDAGDRIYRVPLRYPVPVRVVDAAQIRAIPASPPEIQYPQLQQYVAEIERGPEAPPWFRRDSTTSMSMHARVAQGQLLLVQESFDPSWRAYSGSRAVPVARDPMGFMLLDPGPGEHDILLRFEMPLEKRAGIGITAVTLLAIAWLVRRPWATAKA